MRSIALGIVSLAVLAFPAVAADMSYPVKAPAPVVIPVFSWTGFYIGANVGYGGDKFRYPFHAFADEIHAWRRCRSRKRGGVRGASEPSSRV
jgi:outer membrane immunogenic protein